MGDQHVAQRNKISRAGQKGLEKRRRSTASAAAPGWALLRTCGRSFIGDYKHAADEDDYCSNYGPDH